MLCSLVEVGLGDCLAVFICAASYSQPVWGMALKINLFRVDKGVFWRGGLGEERKLCLYLFILGGCLIILVCVG